MTDERLLAHGGVFPIAVGVAAVIALCATQAAVVLAARSRAGRRPSPGVWRIAAFSVGMLLVAAVLSPVLPVHERFAAHMVQHVVLVGVAAPLLALGLPLVHFLRLVPPPSRRSIHRVRGRLGSFASGRSLLWSAFAAHTAVVWGWHVPWLYEKALAVESVHAFEHVAFLGTAILLWLALAGGGTRSAASGEKLLVLVLTALQGALLGALLAFSSRPWYATYGALSEDAVADQQLAGLLMWSLGGIAPVVAAFLFVAAWVDAPRTRPAVGAHEGR